MDIAALVMWLLTALGGFYLLGTWISRGGVRQQRTGSTRFPAPLIFGHFLLAATGLVLWIIYVVTDTDALAWWAFGVLVPVALLGFTMFFRWLPQYRASGQAGASGRLSPGPGAAAEEEPAEQHFPLVAVLGHGVFAATTIVLVLLAAAAS